MKILTLFFLCFFVNFSETKKSRRKLILDAIKQNPSLNTKQIDFIKNFTSLIGNPKHRNQTLKLF